jgi:uncharacterized membrane protein YeaQ/YmgE (transglycosylase-associated protein family)
VVAGVAGVVGALLGGWLAKMIFNVDTLNTFFNLSTWITAIVGAVILLLVVRTVTGGSGRASRLRRPRRRRDAAARR